MRGRIAIFGTPIRKDPNRPPKMFIAGLIPVTDYAKFITANPSAAKPDANGISTIGKMKMLVAKDGNYAIIAAPDEYAGLLDALKAAKTKSISSRLTAGQLAAASKARIWGYGSVEQAMKLYGPDILAKMEEAKKAIGASKDPNIARASQIMSMYVDAAKTVTSQTKDISITVDPKADVLNIIPAVTAIADTDMAKILASQAGPAKPYRLLGYLPDGAMMNMDTRIDKAYLIKMYDGLIEAMAPMFGPKFTSEEKTKALGRIKETVNSLGNEFACSITAEPNAVPLFSLTYVIEVSDVNAFRKGIDSKVEMVKEPYMQDFFKSFDIKVDCQVKHDAQRHNGVSIDDVNVIVAAADANSQMAQMITKMYGKGLDGRMAMVDGLAFYTLGQKAERRIKTLIDTAKSGGPKQIGDEIRNAAALIVDSNQAQVFGTYNYLRALQMTAGFVPMMPFSTDGLKQISSKSDIAFAAGAGSGSVWLNIAVPKQHILEIKSAFEIIMKNQIQKSQQKSQQMPEPNAKPAKP
jgi:hypothetical protein